MPVIHLKMRWAIRWYLSCDQGVRIQGQRDVVSGKVDGVEGEVVDPVGVEAGVHRDAAGDSAAGRSVVALQRAKRRRRNVHQLGLIRH